ncbi:MAG TPA: hypothetical protein VKP04_03605, partial [Ktedonobacteraceae bacterium]|nr:hypothetical protein [Ktedonobacteraceae bacterium]
MVGDYISTSIVPGDTDANGVFEVAHPPTGAASCSDPGAVCDQDTFTTPEGLLQMVGGTNTSTGDPTVVGTSQPGKFASTNY